MSRTRRPGAPAPRFALPPSWETGDWELVEAIAGADLPGGADALLEMAALDDGTHIVAVTWPAGQRLARTGPATAWAVHEHFDGDLPAHGEDVIDRMWRGAVDALVAALHGGASGDAARRAVERRANRFRPPRSGLRVRGQP